VTRTELALAVEAVGFYLLTPLSFDEVVTDIPRIKPKAPAEKHRSMKRA
jgi:hypothetical protein